MDQATVSGRLRDARPMLPRDDSSLWQQLEAARDRVTNLLRQASEQAGVQGTILPSGPYSSPATVTFEAWLPKSESVTYRTSIAVTITLKPYHLYPIEYTLTVNDRGRVTIVPRLHAVDEAFVTALVAAALAGRKLPSWKPWQLRTPGGLDFWRPANKPKSLQPDMAVIGLWVLVVIMLPIMPPLGIVGLLALPIWQSRRPRAARSIARPHGEPRMLRLCDAWQVVLTGAGDAVELVTERFTTATQQAHISRPGLVEQVERIWHRGLDGIEEREQIALTYGRGVVFVQIYAYGADLYVGWDGHLNLGQWVEQPIASGLDAELGEPVTINTLVTGWQVTTEYDTIDLSCLMEWVHAQLTALLRQLMAERKIDQEIDFRIVRGNRQSLGGQPEEQKPAETRSIWHQDIGSLLRRTA